MKKIKITALILALVMLATLFCACDKDGEAATEPQNIYEVLQGVKTFKTYEYNAVASFDILSNTEAKEEQIFDENGNVIGSYTIDASSMEAKGDIKISGICNAEGNMSLNIALKLEDAEEYIPLTDAYIIGDDFYFNVKAIYEASKSIEAEVGELPPYEYDGDYVKLNIKDLAKEEIDEEINPDANAYATFANEIMAVCVSFVEKASENINPAVMTKDGSKFIFSVSDKNVEQLVQNLGTVLENNYETILASLATKYETAGEAYADIAKALKEAQSEENLESAKEAFVEMKEYKYEDEAPFNSELYVQLTGKTSERNLNCGININMEKDAKNFCKISLAFDAKEISEANITAPGSVMSKESTEEIFGGLSMIG